MKNSKTLQSLLIVLALSLAWPQDHFSATATSDHADPEEVGERIVNNITKRYWGWRYQKACAYYGALTFADATGNKNISAQFEKGYKPYDKGRRKARTGHVDFNVFGIWPLEMYRQNGKESYLETGLRLADLEYETVREDGLTSLARFWVDDMYMVGALQVQAYKATGESKYLDRAALFLKVYIKELQRENYLFHHREDAPYFWGRGNGWAVAALTELLLVLPESHEHHAVLLEAFQNMMATLVDFQGEDGMWHQLIDVPESYPESSCTGMFLYGLISGVDHGWLEKDKYEASVHKGWGALASYVNKRGKARNVCIGTNAKDSKKHYMKRMKTTGNFHGQAAVLWAATAMYQYLESF